MFRRIEITLAVPVVLPLLDILRAEEAKVPIAEGSASTGQLWRSRTNRTDLRTLLALFRPDFDKTGLIAIEERECRAVLRACSFLRLRLRQDQLSTIADKVLEVGLNSDLYAGNERDCVMCYDFLGTLQVIVLSKYVIPMARPTWGMRAMAWVRGVFRLRKPLSNRSTVNEVSSVPPANELWQVVVLNDPVNLMPYVTAVLRSVLCLSSEAAQKRMHEVHELKSSLVWEGPRDQAEAFALVLESWHLQAVCRLK